MSVRGFAVEGIEPLGDGDAVLDFEVTANRPDCMSVVGMAREVATAYGAPDARAAKPDVAAARSLANRGSPVAGSADLTSSSRTPTSARATRAPSPTSRSGRRPTGCRRACRPPASARSATSSTSPTTCCSSSASRCTRSTSRSSAGAEIRVRTAQARRDGSRTLDGQARELSPDMLVIADAERADRRSPA